MTDEITVVEADLAQSCMDNSRGANCYTRTDPTAFNSSTEFTSPTASYSSTAFNFGSKSASNFLLSLRAQL